jgi:hypothetical protein
MSCHSGRELVRELRHQLVACEIALREAEARGELKGLEMCLAAITEPYFGPQFLRNRIVELKKELGDV